MSESGTPAVGTNANRTSAASAANNPTGRGNTPTDAHESPTDVQDTARLTGSLEDRITKRNDFRDIYDVEDEDSTNNRGHLERFVDRIRQGRSRLNAERARQLVEVNFQCELDEDDAGWYNNLQAVHRQIGIVGTHRLGEVEDVGLLSWLGVQMTGHLGLDHAGVAHDANQTAALRTLENLGIGLDWQSLSLNRR